MPKKKTTKTKKLKPAKAIKKPVMNSYQQALSDIKQLVQQARYASARSVNAIMTATYWEIGRWIVKVEQKGQKRADYGEQLIKKMSKDLTKSCGKGFSYTNLKNFGNFISHIFIFKKARHCLPNLLKIQNHKVCLKYRQNYRSFSHSSGQLMSDCSL